MFENRGNQWHDMCPTGSKARLIGTEGAGGPQRRSIFEDRQDLPGPVKPLLHHHRPLCVPLCYLQLPIPEDITYASLLSLSLSSLSPLYLARRAAHAELQMLSSVIKLSCEGWGIHPTQRAALN